MVGWLRLTVQGPAGTTVTLRHAEVLDKDGNFYTDNLRGARAAVQYTLKGGDVETFETQARDHDDGWEYQFAVVRAPA